jgi:hypothetical protein
MVVKSILSQRYQSALLWSSCSVYQRFGLLCKLHSLKLSFDFRCMAVRRPFNIGFMKQGVSDDEETYLQPVDDRNGYDAF